MSRRREFEFGSRADACEACVPAKPAEKAGRCGMNSVAQTGPHCNPGLRRDVCGVPAKSIAEGAAPLAGGGASERAGPDEGDFHRPAILGDTQRRRIRGQEKICGPVLPAIECDSFDQAIEMLNGTGFGLASALFSNSSSGMQRFPAESRHGMMHVNRGAVPDSNMPFGGTGNSGASGAAWPTAVNFRTSEHSACIAW